MNSNEPELPLFVHHHHELSVLERLELRVKIAAAVGRHLSHFTLTSTTDNQFQRCMFETVILGDLDLTPAQVGGARAIIAAQLQPGAAEQAETDYHFFSIARRIVKDELATSEIALGINYMPDLWDEALRELLLFEDLGD